MEALAPSAKDSAATRALLKHLEKGSTGRLALGAGAIAVRVYVQEGHLLAAEGAEDVSALLRRLSLQGSVPESRHRELVAMVELGEPAFGALLDEVPPDVLDPVLHERFRDNLARFLGAEGMPKFESLSGVFVDNLQLGYDARQLVESCSSMWDAAMRIELDTELVPGPHRPADPRHRAVLEALEETRVVSSLIGRLPLEPIAARAMIAEMLEAGFVVVAGDLEEDDLAVDEPTEMVERSDVEPPSAADEDAEVIERVRADDESVDDPPTAGGVARPPAVEAVGAGDLTSLDAWMSKAAQVEEDLDAFADHDEVRGGAQDGGFTTDKRDLDHVEVATLPDDVIEAGEAPTAARFGAPVLSDEEAESKVAVANDVLVSVVATFDEEQGNGGGRAALQLLLEGAPSRYAPLFQHVMVAEDGAIPYRQILRNLQHRPSTEHRQLLNEGLVDLIERALSLAADELPDQAVDEMLERVAGYRQRMGL